ncbi:biotin-independent malonate decarboxylase subunit gamma [Methylocella sp.]|uniref:biotin-independent malonate decarboxylase subunit gamma n=1 Tax=Methylocella sp. TaxID=1978226 RepID=UPI003784AC28
MTLDEILASLFPDGGVRVDDDGLISGEGAVPGVGAAHVVGVARGTALGVEAAARLARMTLDILGGARKGPILVLIDSDSQRMSRRDELLGLSEYLAHLAKCLNLAERSGVRTVGILYGHTAAGAFIATALATGVLVALPGAHPEVMDLPSMARVTKLPLDLLNEKAKSTPVFAPGVDNLARTGAVLEIWDPARPLGAQLAALLAKPADGADARDALGAARGGRPKARDVAARVERLANADG